MFNNKVLTGIGGVIYLGCLLFLALTYDAGVGKFVIGLGGGFGALFVLYNYLEKRDLVYASWRAKHGEAPVSRLFILVLALLWLVLYPLSFVPGN